MLCKHILILVIFVSVPYLLQAQDFHVDNTGVRARSMAGAYIGIADDVTAVFWNPAGLAQNKGIEGYLSIEKEAYQISTPQKIEGFNTDAWKSSHCSPDFLGIKFPFPFVNKRKKLMISIACQKMLDFFYKYNNSEEKFSKEQDGYVRSYSLSSGYHISDSLYIGMTVNYYNGWKSFKFIDDSSGYWGGNAEEDSSYSGFGWIPNIGALYRHYPFKVGLVIKFPFELKEQNRDNEGKYEAKIQMPWMIGIGYGFNFSKNIILSADFEWQEYSNLYRYKKVSEPFQNVIKERIGLTNIWQVRCGTEFKAKIWKFKVPIRVGIASTPSIYKDLNNKQIKGVLATVGTRIVYKRFYADVGFEYNTYSYKVPDKGKYREHYLRFLFALIFRLGDKH